MSLTKAPATASGPSLSGRHTVLHGAMGRLGSHRHLPHASHTAHMASRMPISHMGTHRGYVPATAPAGCAQPESGWCAGLAPTVVAGGLWPKAGTLADPAGRSCASLLLSLLTLQDITHELRKLRKRLNSGLCPPIPLGRAGLQWAVEHNRPDTSPLVTPLTLGSPAA